MNSSPNLSKNFEIMDYILRSNLRNYPFKTIRNASTDFKDLRVSTISEMCLGSLPLESARPGESIKYILTWDPLHVKSLHEVSAVYDSNFALTVNIFYIPDKVLSKELFPDPVDPITTTFFGLSWDWISISIWLSKFDPPWGIWEN